MSTTHTTSDQTPSAPSALRPSDVAPPTQVDTASQQASTQPGDGSEVRDPAAGASTVGATPELPKVPFKDQVIAHAKKSRGTLLGKPELKEHGNQILQGQADAREPTRKPSV
ncbi:hypothetical protein BV25DRAFT_1823662 [Artomyces pyxidatus]|uniref:Uncharacterized protein n=1 Tax=Artomyces pyxidatus TaxID=48021 RepID=A0ACB8T6S5_9AGAM|nr:hypothetical protein BV25DRAFT_1823662 [Artomyces pyxidatus]